MNEGILTEDVSPAVLKLLSEIHDTVTESARFLARMDTIITELADLYVCLNDRVEDLEETQNPINND